MSGFDGTGPRGLGPRTGGGRGFCSVPPGSAGIPYRSRDFAGGYWAAYPGLSSQGELELLKNEFTLLQKELELIEVKIKAIEAQKSE